MHQLAQISLILRHPFWGFVIVENQKLFFAQSNFRTTFSKTHHFLELSCFSEK
jgi:hypothetical protein